MAKNTMGDFAGRMGKRAKNVIRNTDLVVRKMAITVDGTVVLATPVKTGRARGNWQVEVGAEPPQGVLETTDPGGARAIELAKTAIAQYKGGQGNAIHITNNLPYIGRLNNGHSAQAPAGFVEKAVMTGIQALNGVTLTKDQPPE